MSEHKWWHWFFRKWIRTKYNPSRDTSTEIFYCPFCKMIYEDKINEIGERVDRKWRDAYE